MSGNREGGIKAAKTNMIKYGKNFYSEIGAKGGANGHTGGFASNKELARTAGAKGGKISKRGKNLQKKLDEIFSPYIKSELDKGTSIHQIALKIGVADCTIKKYCADNGLARCGKL